MSHENDNWRCCGEHEAAHRRAVEWLLAEARVLAIRYRNLAVIDLAFQGHTTQTTGASLGGEVMALNITIGLRESEPEPRTTWIDDTPVLEVRPHVTLVFYEVGAVERLRDALSLIVDGFRTRDANWADEQAELDRNDQAAVVNW